MYFIIYFYILQENLGPQIVSEDGDYSVVQLRKPLANTVSSHCDRVRDAVQGLIETYCHAFRVDFQLNSRAENPVGELTFIFRM